MAGIKRESCRQKPGNERKIFILSVSDEERSKRLRECFDFQWVELSLSLLLGPSFPQKVEQTPVLAAIRQIHIKKSEKKKNSSHTPQDAAGVEDRSTNRHFTASSV